MTISVESPESTTPKTIPAALPTDEAPKAAAMEIPTIEADGNIAVRVEELPVEHVIEHCACPNHDAAPEPEDEDASLGDELEAPALPAKE